MSHQAVEHLFRHEYGQLVALLTRRFGIEHIETIEDSVQWSMAQALEKWTHTESNRATVPENSSGWLYKASYNRIISELRAVKRHNELLQKQADNQTALAIKNSEQNELSDLTLSGELKDSLLRMLFFACNSALPVESQLVFTLKTLCGFSIKEVASRLFISEENAYKRFSRAKVILKKLSKEFPEMPEEQLNDRLDLVYRVLYLIFTEGYLSSHGKEAIRTELCDEALRLALVLLDSNVGRKPESYALIALMYLQSARINTRKNSSGALQLLEFQERSKWNSDLITKGLHFLHASTNSESISRYHIEAGIAAEHCIAKSYEDTRWEKIVDSYCLLEKLSHSPLHTLNRAIATAEWKGAKAGLDVLERTKAPGWLTKSYHWYAVMADLNFRSGNKELGTEYMNLAFDTSPTKEIEDLLKQRLEQY
ncbi:sigma-70 family RNA polymerase sigma factor [Aliikangiella marina]|uniref:Sigma-70 family RNA polymerase sigma factor n=1 Tax=Aliikangiella marina TaxID=1712262 RepID=A0A545T4R8_9GAMM|nr:sigma-70 family RNA polymerase sigma factor [Aliikangiella marina]TQV72213.1 sigma-70 family RNA polymerase sigma factor [Aliikangiella marina]